MNVWMRPHVAAREAQGAYVHLVQAIAPKGTGQQQQFLKNATSLIRQSVDHGSAT